eukprot:7361-Chlamydomonas_euryale.AAC.2
MLDWPTRFPAGSAAANATIIAPAPEPAAIAAAAVLQCVPRSSMVVHRQQARGLGRQSQKDVASGGRSAVAAAAIRAVALFDQHLAHNRQQGPRDAAAAGSVHEQRKRAGNIRRDRAANRPGHLG